MADVEMSDAPVSAKKAEGKKKFEVKKVGLHTPAVSYVGHPDIDVWTVERRCPVGMGHCGG